ncbi:MAG: PAS domain-containing protein [Proteobacteria bacterium]|nr:PAS domain-containing protein [Pseudomonadota bacterium]
MADSMPKIKGLHTKAYLRPLSIFIILLITIFIVEALVMFIISFLPAMSTSEESLFDAFLLTLLATPLFYFIVVRPMINNVLTLNEVDAELHEAHAKLEERVKERTAELKKANEKLRDEILEHRRTEASLVENEGNYRALSQQFHALLDAIPDRLVLLSPDLTVQWTNKNSSLEQNNGMMEPLNVNCYELWQKASAPCEMCPSLSSFKTGEVAESIMKRDDGALYEVRAVPIKNESGDVVNVIEICSDVTEKDRMQKEAMRSDQLASIGELAAGVAHEINNPINGIINYAQIIANKSPKKSDEHDIAGRIIKEGDRVAVIVRSLLSFAHENQEGKKVVSVMEVISDCLILTKKQMEKENIIVKVDIPPELPQIKANYQQLEQVFLNFITNARYALNQKYPVADKNKIFEISAQEVKEGRLPCLRIIFSDYGIGVPAEIQEKIFDPFFSTKPEGSGTGLGLSISHGIINDHGGKLNLESREGEFARIYVDFPIMAVNDGLNDTGDE